MNEVQSLVLSTLREIRNVLVDNACKAVELNPDQNLEQFPARLQARFKAKQPRGEKGVFHGFPTRVASFVRVSVPVHDP